MKKYLIILTCLVLGLLGFLISGLFYLDKEIQEIKGFLASDQRISEMSRHYQKLLEHFVLLKAKEGVQTGRYDNARMDFDKLLELNPEVKQANYEMALMAFKQNDIESAMVYALAEEKVNEWAIDNLVLLGTLFTLNKDYVKAESYFERVLQSEAFHFEATNNLAEIYRMKNEPSKAVSKLDAYLLANKNDDFMRFKLYMARLSDGDVDGVAERTFNYLNDNPKNGYLHLVAVCLYLLKDDADSASKHLAISKTLVPAARFSMAIKDELLKKLLIGAGLH